MPLPLSRRIELKAALIEKSNRHDLVFHRNSLLSRLARRLADLLDSSSLQPGLSATAPFWPTLRSP